MSVRTRIREGYKQKTYSSGEYVIDVQVKEFVSFNNTQPLVSVVLINERWIVNSIQEGKLCDQALFIHGISSGAFSISTLSKKKIGERTKSSLKRNHSPSDENV